MERKQISRLPLTRKEQFFYLLRYETPFLFLYGLIAFLFLIPLLACCFTLMLLTRSFVSNGATPTELFNLYLLFGIMVALCTFIFGIGNMGLFNNVKELVFESSSHLSSFFVGIKKNFKSFYKYYILLSILLGLLVVNLGDVMFIKTNYSGKIIVFAINLILVTLTILIKPYVMFEATVFDNSLVAYLRNGFHFFGKSFLKSLLSFLLYVAPYVLVVVLPIDLLFIPVALLAVGYISLYAIANFIFNLDLFENSLPKDQIESIYHVGLEN